jgi:hypothetical protein
MVRQVHNRRINALFDASHPNFRLRREAEVSGTATERPHSEDGADHPKRVLEDCPRPTSDIRRGSLPDLYQVVAAANKLVVTPVTGLG